MNMTRPTRPLGNVFLRQRVARSFEESTRIPPESFLEMGQFVLSTLDTTSEPRPGPLSVVDIGTGTGRTILGMLRAFVERQVAFRCLCLDSSAAMAARFEENLAAFPARRDVRFLLHDANDGLPRDAWETRPDMIFIVSMLQYLNDWRGLLDQCARQLARTRGYLVQAELAGWYRMLDGRIDTPTQDPALECEFWSRYFRLRQEVAPWVPEIHFARMEPVFSYCQSELAMMPVGRRTFLWTNEISWSDVLGWIGTGVVSSLGSDIDDESKREWLRSEMARFLLERGVDLARPFTISWGFDLWVHKVGGARE